MRNILIIGAGAAGTFAALTSAVEYPSARVILTEKSHQPLAKVRISGGGRCNVTTSEIEPKRLSSNYPRGERELLGPFHRFGPADMITWLAERGVKLKTEPDGRMFPVTDSSQTIIDCFLDEAKKLGVELQLGVRFSELPLEEYDAVLLATGSSPQGHRLAESVGHNVTPLAPSLFSLNIPDESLHALSGTSLENAQVSLPEIELKQTGPLLVTHWGFSGPAALKLSAWGALKLKELNYRTPLLVNWAPGHILKKQPNKSLIASRPEGLSKRLWSYILNRAGVESEKLWAHLGKKGEAKLEEVLHRDRYQIEGRTTNKDEFVTCGGVDLKEVDMRTMRSKIVPNLYFAGEVLNIDAVTGGFNFQAAWTTGWLAAQAML
jgi:predicted Rossmann fold flavoprotein